MITGFKTGWLWATLLGVCATGQAQTHGLIADPDVWPRWQGRVSVGIPQAIGPARVGLASSLSLNPRPEQTSLSLLGDYYLSGPGSGARQFGGLRASGGLFIGPPSARWAGQASTPSARRGAFSLERRALGASSSHLLPGDAGSDTSAVPYVGLGYTATSASGRWGYSADLGLMAGARDGIRLGRGLTGGQALDDAIRDMRWSPVLQLGVSYSF